MAGGHDGPVKLDPAIERWNTMREAVYKTFRFTPRTTIQSLLGMLIVPGAICYLCATTEHKWKWNGKRKGEPLTEA